MEGGWCGKEEEIRNQNNDPTNIWFMNNKINRLYAWRESFEPHENMMIHKWLGIMRSIKRLFDIKIIHIN